MLAEIPPQVCRFSKICLDSYLHVLAEIPPWVADFPKSTEITCHCDSYLSYLHVLAEIPPTSLQIFQNLPLDRYLNYQCACTEISPWSLQIFPKSATGQLPKLPTCACRNFPLGCRFSKICHWTVT